MILWSVSGAKDFYFRNSEKIAANKATKVTYIPCLIYRHFVFPVTAAFLCPFMFYFFIANNKFSEDDDGYFPIKLNALA
jgi:hypothetical protein